MLATLPAAVSPATITGPTPLAHAQTNTLHKWPRYQPVGRLLDLCCRVDVLVIASQRRMTVRSRWPAVRTVDAALDGRLAAVLADLGASGDEGEVTRFASLGAMTAPVIAAVGLGEIEGEPRDDAVRRATGAAIRALVGRETVALSLPGNPAAVAEGALLAAYAVKPSTNGKNPVSSVVILGAEDADATAESSRPGRDTRARPSPWPVTSATCRPTCCHPRSSPTGRSPRRRAPGSRSPSSMRRSSRRGASAASSASARAR